MSVELHDSRTRLSAALRGVSDLLPPTSITLRSLLELTGEQGMLLVCVFLTVPFLLPISIPGVSTVFGLAIVLIALAVTFNRVPWLPRRILDRPLPTPPLRQAFQRGGRLVARFERMVRPRWPVLTATAAANVVHGAALTFAGILLMMPLGLVPFSNTLPAVAILVLSLGMLERDGVFIVGGYLVTVATVVYFVLLVAGAWMAGGTLLGHGGAC